MGSPTLAPDDVGRSCGAYSARFRQAAATEQARLTRKRERVATKAAQARDTLATNEQEIGDLDREIAVLGALAGEGASADPVARAAVDGSRVLSGKAIREVAVQALVEQGRGGQPVHYREWLQLVEDAGFGVAGKRPDAVFLAQVTRSPVVRGAGEAGFYEVDLEAPARLREKVRAIRQGLVAVAAEEHSSVAGLADQAARTQALSLDIRRAERALAEAVRTVGDGHCNEKGA